MVDFVAIGSIIIDDIVDAEGHTHMGLLGGGAGHAVAGMRVWSDRTGLASVIGQPFPDTAWAHLTALADTRGIVARPAPQPRFWLLFEHDGRRNEAPRIDFTLFQKMSIRPDEYPPAFAPAKGVYLQCATAAEAEAWRYQLKALNPDIVILWEPWRIFYKPENLADFCRVASLFEAVSPQTVELASMLEETEPERQAALLVERGVRCLALRMGAAGSLIATAKGQRHIPAISGLPVVDETGAGNAYCGGFVVGYVESGGDLLAAGRYGTVSATFALAQVGIPHLGPDVRVEADRRLKMIR
jgi:sugar/nucleoside kinase (ribokinase family)